MKKHKRMRVLVAGRLINLYEYSVSDHLLDRLRIRLGDDHFCVRLEDFLRTQLWCGL